jgi:hypothetical protein
MRSGADLHAQRFILWQCYVVDASAHLRARPAAILRCPLAASGDDRPDQRERAQVEDAPPRERRQPRAREHRLQLGGGAHAVPAAPEGGDRAQPATTCAWNWERQSCS